MRTISNCFEQEKLEESLTQQNKEVTMSKKLLIIVSFISCCIGIVGGFGTYYIYSSLTKPWWVFW